MKTLIVAKTRMKTGVCISGLTMKDYRNVRLIPVGRHNNPDNTPFEVGQVWDIVFSPKNDIILPHSEDVFFYQSRFIGPMVKISDYLQNFAEIMKGGMRNLFNGLLMRTERGSAYICRRVGIPSHSVEFWISDKDIEKETESNRIRYRYRSEDGFVFLPFVGLQACVDLIPAGTLIRLSLARWWTPSDKPEWEERCYLQLSGWYE